jgi:hypothetical protein
VLSPAAQIGDRAAGRSTLVVRRTRRRQPRRACHVTLRPTNRETTNRTRKNTKSTFAIQAAVPAIPAKPSNPASSAMIKNVAAQPNIRVPFDLMRNEHGFEPATPPEPQAAVCRALSTRALCRLRRQRHPVKPMLCHPWAMRRGDCRASPSNPTPAQASVRSRSHGIKPASAGALWPGRGELVPAIFTLPSWGQDVPTPESGA